MSSVGKCIVSFILSSLLWTFISSFLHAQAEPGPQVFLGATVDLTAALGESGAPEVHELIRGDSLYDNLRVRLFGDVVINRRLTVFTQFLLDPAIRFGFESFLRAYVRYLVFENSKGDLSIQAGKIPTVFGTFGARAYSDRNPFLSSPLMYHFFSSLRSNQLPAENAELLKERGHGLAREFGGFTGGGMPIPFNGLPIVYDACWDGGIEAVGSIWRFEYKLAVTEGTLSAPQFKLADSNDGRQIAYRIGFVASPQLMVGTSFARGPYLDSSVEFGLMESGRSAEDFNQQAWGLDLEYGVGHLEVIAEIASNKWESPNIRNRRGDSQDLRNLGWYIEGKYALRPGLYVAVRHDQINFAEIDDGSGSGKQIDWDYDIRAWEWGLGYYVTDRVIAKFFRKDYDTDEPGSSNRHFWGVQLATSF